MKAHRLYILLVCFFACSCANVNQNISKGEPSAQIRFVDLTGGGSENRYISSYKNEACEDLKSVGILSGIAIMNTHRQSLGMPLGDNIASSLKTEVSVAPGSFTYWIGTDIGGNYFSGIQFARRVCGVSNTFKVVQNHFYEVTFEKAQDGQCTSKVYELISDDIGNYSRIPEVSLHPTATQCNAPKKSSE